jgi:hypothetical protein
MPASNSGSRAIPFKRTWVLVSPRGITGSKPDTSTRRRAASSVMQMLRTGSPKSPRNAI